VIAPGPRHNAIVSAAIGTGAGFGLAIGIGGTAAAVATAALLAVGEIVHRHARLELRSVDVRLDADRLAVETTTGLVRRRQSVSVASIDQLHVEAGAAAQPYRLFLWHGPDCRMLAEVARLDEALYVERVIEEWLGIPDRRVAGEVRR
jgi:hypothetical protein